MPNRPLLLVVLSFTLVNGMGSVSGRDDRVVVPGPGHFQRVAVGADHAGPQVSPPDLARITPIEQGLWEIEGLKTGKGLLSWQGAIAPKAIEVGTTPVAESPSFQREILPLLTRAGCNQGACHGKGAGQNGFRLSLRGYAPEWDHAWLTREYMGRRMDRNDPEASSFLRKALGLAPHEGGRRIQPGSRGHRLLSRWVESGMPGPDPKEPPLARLELTPNLTSLKPGQGAGLLVTAHFQDGSKVDVSWLARFDSRDPALVACTSHGWVSALRPGETTIGASYGSEFAIATVRVPFPLAGTNPQPGHSPVHPLDQQMEKQWRALGLTPAGPCSDGEFLRRASLDATGRLPSLERIRQFERDGAPDKRARWVDQLLEDPATTDRWTLFFADLLQNRKERDHDVCGIRGVRRFHAWLRDQVDRDTPWDELTRRILTAQGNTEENPAVGYFIVTVGEHQDPTRSEIAASVAQSFLGTRIGCAQCHNHPLERYTQNDYYHFAGFFSRVKLERKDPLQGTTQLTLSKTLQKPGAVQPRTGAFLEPRPLDRSTPGKNHNEDPRVELADWLSGPGRRDLAGALANRIWRELFGKGLVEPVDDLRATNPPIAPEAWKVVVDAFLEHQLKPRELIRFLMKSQVYQKSSATLGTPVEDDRWFHRHLARRMGAETLLDAVSDLTGVPESYPGYPLGLRAQQLPDPQFPSHFLRIFGRSERVTACACEREGEITLPQMLHLRNSQEIQARIRHPRGRIAQSLARGESPATIARDLHLLALGRPLEAKTETLIRLELENGEPAEVLADLMWALINSKEFAFNR